MNFTDSLPLDWIARAASARRVKSAAQLQLLWSGYGAILRLELEGGERSSVIVKQVRPPAELNHPRGWSGARSHLRKLRSYQVETHFYGHQGCCLSELSRVPACFGSRGGSASEGWLLVLEDLDASGFAGRRAEVSQRDVELCLRWLAHFHAAFLGCTPHGLWPVGTYWHLETRPDELEVLADRALREAAPRIDALLNSARYKTLVHGDAKLANFCFGDNAVAAVDFQYVGGGVGVKDVAYFLSSCWREPECMRRLLEFYFAELGEALRQRRPEFSAASRRELEEEWRGLYEFAWADFYRFLAGWAPDHWKLNPMSQRLTERALRKLGVLAWIPK